VRTIQSALPRRELMPFVKVFAQRDIPYTAAGFSQRDLASLEQILAFDFRDSGRINYANGQNKIIPPIHAVGSQTSSTGCAHFNGCHLGFGIFLKPLACWQLFRISPAALANQNGDGNDLLGNGIRSLWLRLGECSTFQERIRVAEGYLLPFAINALAQTSIMTSAQHIFHHNGAVRIDELANHSGLSVRHYERRFAAEIGFTPKLFARITRFQAALDAKRMAPHQSWMSVAHQFGYFDQMHLIRDFQSLGGDSPILLSEQIGDHRPWSLASPMTPHDLPQPPQSLRFHN
jgi:AraC-like DNA-binding protein